jgi:2-haloacid dehalogenase
VLSGEVRLLKPDPRIFQHLFTSFAIDPAQAIYIDDLAANVETANALGMHGILFTDASTVHDELLRVGLLHPAGQITS